MSFVKRVPLYLLALIPSLGLLLETMSRQRFNIDEFQHTHLAWVSLHTDKLQYREIWDNHGPLYTIVNALFIKLANLGASVATILAERYLNLVLLLIGFVVLFELFRLLTGKWYFAILGPWFFASSLHSIHAIEVRPDNLQCLFFYLALLLLVKAFEYQSKNHALVSGIFLTFMLMTNLKSLTALFAIIFSILFLRLFWNDTKAISYLKSLLVGLLLSLVLSVALLWATGLLDGYIRDNILFNFTVVQFENLGAQRKLLRFFVTDNHFYLPLLLISLLTWIGTSVDLRITKVHQARFIIAGVVTILVISRFFVNLWTQYDLIFVPLLCFIASSIMFESLENNLLAKFSSGKYKVLILSFVVVVLLALGWYKYFNAPSNRLSAYHKALDSHINELTGILSNGGTMENTSLRSPEIAFLPTASSRFIIQRLIIDGDEKVYGRRIYGEEYIDLLKERDVRIIIGGEKMPEIFPDPNVSKFIREHYKLKNRYWQRKDLLR